MLLPRGERDENTCFGLLRQLTLLMHVNAYCWFNEWCNSLSGSMINALLINKLSVGLCMEPLRGTWWQLRDGCNSGMNKVPDLSRLKYFNKTYQRKISNTCMIKKLFTY